MKDVLAIHRALLEHETPHEIVRLRHAVTAADEIPGVLGTSNERCLAVRLYDTPAGLVATLVHAGQVPPTLAVLSAAGVRTARPAPPDMVNRVTDYAADLVAPVLLPSHLSMFVDRAVLRAAETGGAGDPGNVVYTATGDSGTALGIHACDLLRISRAAPADLATRDVELPLLPGAMRPPPRPLDSSLAGRGRL